MTEPQPATFSKLAGPPGLALIALLVVCVLAPPEVHGLGLVGMALLTALAAFAAGPPAAATWLLAALAAGLVAIRMALAPGEAVEPTVTWLLAASAGLAATRLGVGELRLAQLLGGLLAIVSLRAVYESLWGLASWADRAREAVQAADTAAVLNRLEQGRPYAGFVTPAALGCFLAMTIPPVVFWALARKDRGRALGFAAAAAGVAALLLTRSVTALVALAGALAFAALGRRIRPRVFAGAGLALGLAVIAAGLVRPDAVFAPSREDSPSRLRAGNMRVALEIARDHPWAGVGPAGYAAAFPQYRRPGDNESRHAHSLPLELIAECGVPAGLGLTALFFWLFLGPVIRSGGGAPTLRSGLAIGLAAFALHNLVDFTAFLPSLLVLATVTRGLLADGDDVVNPGRPLRAAWATALVGLAMVACGSGLSREALFDARQAALGGDHAASVAAAERAQKLAPWDADAPQIEAEARIAGNVAEPAAVLSAAERSVARAPARASSRGTRARARSLAGDEAGAYADLVEAARLYPLNREYASRRDAMAATLRRAEDKAPR
jgi:O-antigen ligase